MKSEESRAGSGEAQEWVTVGQLPWVPWVRLTHSAVSPSASLESTISPTGTPCWLPSVTFAGGAEVLGRCNPAIGLSMAPIPASGGFAMQCPGVISDKR